MDADVHPGPAAPVVVVVRFVSLAWMTAGGPTIMLLFSGKRTRLLRPRSRLLPFAPLRLPWTVPRRVPRPRIRRLLLERPDAPGALCRPRGTLLLLSVQSAAALAV